MAHTRYVAAADLASRGLPVFPLWWPVAGGCACGGSHGPANTGKHPIASGWQAQATADPAAVSQMWAGYPDANIGHPVQPGWLIVDRDPRNGGDETFARLASERGFPPTWTTRTGGGGVHLWYRVPEGLRFPARLGDGLDLKQPGGYVVLPPSLHSSGENYTWAVNWSTLPSPAHAPAWIVSLGRELPEAEEFEITEDEGRAVDDSAIEWIASAIAPHFVPGRKHHMAYALGGWLRQRGFGAEDIREIVTRLPTDNPTGRVTDALDGAQHPQGWTKIRDLIGEQAAGQLEHAIPNPRWTRTLADRADAERTLGPALAASAAATPQAVGLDGLPAWYAPTDLAAPVAPMRFLVPELELGPGRVSMIAGYSNAGKSIAAQALAFGVALGRPVWGRFHAVPARTLYLDRENGEIARENFRRMAHAAGVGLDQMSPFVSLVKSGILLDAPNAEAELEAVIRLEGFGFVVIDTLRASVPSLDENKAEICQPLYSLGRISQRTGATIVVLHHERKPDGDRRSSAEFMISGHNAIHGALQVAYSLVSDKDSGLIHVRGAKRLRRGFDPFHLRVRDIGGDVPGDVGAAIASAGAPSPGVVVEVATDKPAPPKPENEDTPSTARDRVLAFLREHAPDGSEIRRQEILHYVTGKRSNTIAAMFDLQRQGAIRVAGSPQMVSLVVDTPLRTSPPPPEPSYWRNQAEFAEAIKRPTNDSDHP